MVNFLDQSYWDNVYRDHALVAAREDNTIVQWLLSYLPRGCGRCLEIGCFPGQFLPWIGKLGYELHGIDLTPRVAVELRPWLESLGCRTGDFALADFWSWEPSSLYEIVCSYGFIEHFPEMSVVLRRQAEWVAEGGYLVVTAPNFRGILQRGLHRLLDPENLERHIVEVMDPRSWQEIVEPLGFEILHAGFLGRFNFWWGEQRRTMLQDLGLSVVQKIKPVLARLPAGCPMYAPYCGLIARKLER